MCGRYLTPDEADFERHFGLGVPAGWARSYNVAPSQAAAVIRWRPEGGLEASMLVWGFRPGWAKRAWINARSESVLDSKAFAKAARRHRCLVPAAGWYEWQGEATPKQPWVFHRDFEPFAFAGVWTARKVDDVWERSFAILTRAAPAALAGYHDRMPVVLEPAAYAEWLSPDAGEADVERVLRAAADEFAARPVSRFVNKPENDGERCIAPL